MKKIFFIASFAAVVMASCNNDEPNNPDDAKPKGVYIAGYGYNTKGTSVAMLWKDSVTLYLTDGGYDACANSIYVADSSGVYTVGYAAADAGNQLTPTTCAALWKNNVRQYLDSKDGNARAVYVSGNDVYVAGDEYENGKTCATLWKNGVAGRLEHDGTSSFAFDLYVSGSDVYVVGYVIGRTAGKRTEAVLWHNNKVQYMEQQTRGAAYSVCVSGSDVYVLGEMVESGEKYIATLWRNSVVAQRLSSGDNNTYGEHVAVVGSDVYVAGYEKNTAGKHVALLWKNGVLQPRTGSYNGYINRVYLHGSDLYAVGFEEPANGKRIAVLWKNGVPQYLSGDKPSRANSVFVK